MLGAVAIARPRKERCETEEPTAGQIRSQYLRLAKRHHPDSLARGVHDDHELLEDADEKLRWICHAEGNAILNAGRSGVAVRGCTIYVTKFPCLSCCNAIAQGGLACIYTDDHRYRDDDPLDGTDADYPHSRKQALLRQVGIRVIADNHPDFSRRWHLAHPGRDRDLPSADRNDVQNRRPTTGGRRHSSLRKPLAKVLAQRTPRYLPKREV
jgi:dCMP deaminase